MAHRLGIDLGGTSAKIALVGAGNKVIRDTSVATGRPRPSELARLLAYSCKSLMKGQRISHIGIGVAGDIDSTNGIVRVSPNLGWKNVPLAKLVSKQAQCRVVIENDAKVAAWGLYKTQVPDSIKHLIVMTLGTGVGGGIILNGQLHRGATGSAGEVGHMNIEERGPLCNCGNRGCLETYVGAPHLIKRIKKDLARGQRSLLQKIYREDPELISPFELAKAAKKGDSYARSVWNGVGHALGIVIGDLVYLLNPQMIVFTGGIAQAGDLILKPLHRTLNLRSFKTPVRAVRIKVASNATQVGVIGASLL